MGGNLDYFSGINGTWNRPITMCLKKRANFGKLQFQQAWTDFDNLW